MYDIVGLGKFLKEALTEYDPVFYEPPDEDLWGVGSDVIPSTGDLPLGLESFVAFRTEVIGRAAVTIGAYDIPMVDNAKSASTAKVLSVVASSEWSVPQLEAHRLAQKAGILPGENLIETNTYSISVACNRRIHELVVFGMPEIGFEGLLTTTQIPTIDDSATEVLQMTPDDAYNWFQGVVADFKVISKMPYSSIVAYVPDDLLKLLARRFGAGSNESPLIALTASDRGTYMKAVRSLTELDTASLVAAGLSTANKGMMLIGDFDNKRSILRRFVSLDKNGPFLKDTGFHYGLTGWSGTSEVMFKNPQRFARIKFGTAPKH